MPGIFISLAISFLLFLYAPIDLYCANTAEFWFDFSTLLITALGMFAACFAVLAVLYLIAMLIHPYVYRYQGLDEDVSDGGFCLSYALESQCAQADSRGIRRGSFSFGEYVLH